MRRCVRASRATWLRCEPAHGAMSAGWTEWWTYRPSDFLMFAPHIYWRLFESLNAAWWPAQPLLVGAALAWFAAWARPRAAAVGLLRWAALGLAACWALVAWTFLQQRFAPINWIASAYAAAFVAQALGLLMLGLGGAVRGTASRLRRAAGAALLLWALLGHPLLALAAGRPWLQAEVFGLAPDPTVIFTLGYLLLLDADAAHGRWALRLLWLLPLAWCVVGFATLATMGSLQSVLLLLAAVLALGVASRREAHAAGSS